MVEHKCVICGKIFKQKCHLRDHLNRKKTCKIPTILEPVLTKKEPPKKEHVNTNLVKIEPFCELSREKEYKCKFCYKIFSTKSHNNRHIKQNCKKRKAIEEEKEDIFRKLLEKMETLEKENIEIKEKNKQLEHKITHVICAKRTYKKNNISNCNNVHNTQNNIVNNNNTIVLVGCGKEDIMKLDKQKIVRAVSAGFYSTNKLTDLVHFDPKHPEYHNVYIGNMKDRTNDKICKNFIIWLDI